MAIDKAQMEAIVHTAEEGYSLSAKVVNLRDDKGCTPLHYAAAEGRIIAIAALVQAGAKLDAQDNDARRPVHYAVINNRINAVKDLAKKGANLTAQDIHGQTVLDYAKEKCHLYMEFILCKLMGVSSKNDVNDPLYALELLYSATYRFYSLLWEEKVPLTEQQKYLAYLNAGLEKALGFACPGIESPLVFMSDELSEVYVLVLKMAQSLRGVVPMPAFYDTLTKDDFDTVYWRYAAIRDAVQKEIHKRARPTESSDIQNRNPILMKNEEQCVQLEALRKAMRVLETMLVGLPQEQQSIAYAIANEQISDKLGFNYVGRRNVPIEIKLPAQVLDEIEKIAASAEPLCGKVAKPQHYITNIIDDYFSSAWRYNIVLEKIEAQLKSNGYVFEERKEQSIFFDEKDYVECSSKILPDAGLEIEGISFKEEGILPEQDAQREKTTAEAQENLARLQAEFDANASELAAIASQPSSPSGLGGGSAYFRFPNSELHCASTSNAPQSSSIKVVFNQSE